MQYVNACVQFIKNNTETKKIQIKELYFILKINACNAMRN